MNLAVLIGRLGCPPERRVTSTGKNLCALRMATGYKPKEGEEVTDWHDVVVWGEAGRACVEHLTTGRMVAVTGRIQTRSWEDDKGEKKWRTEVVAQKVDFMPRSEEPEAVPPGSGPTLVKTDDLPF
jgi:single-strand DNA-binding protein